MSRARKIIWILRLDMLILILVLNALAWMSPRFTDAYVAKVFPIWGQTYGRLTGWMRFSVGEVMILILLLLLGMSLLLVIPAILLRRRTSFFKKFYRVELRLVLPVLLIMTLNCTMLYHTSPIRVVKAGAQVPVGNHVTADNSLEVTGASEATVQGLRLLTLYNTLVDDANELASRMDRTGRGEVLYAEDLFAQAIEYMRAQGERYPLLRGYYSRTKVITNSWFLSQQYIAGYYFPFSLESNINGMMYIVNKPFTVCHELAHVKGFIREDEANFIGFVAGYESGNDFFRYSAILGVLPYVADDLRECFRNGSLIGKEKEYRIATPSDAVAEDSIFLTEEAWAEVEETSAFSTETVSKVTDAALEGNLQLNGVESGMDNYCEVVRLLLDYLVQ